MFMRGSAKSSAPAVGLHSKTRRPAVDVAVAVNRETVQRHTDQVGRSTLFVNLSGDTGRQTVVVVAVAGIGRRRMPVAVVNEMRGPALSGWAGETVGRVVLERAGTVTDNFCRLVKTGA